MKKDELFKKLTKKSKKSNINTGKISVLNHLEFITEAQKKGYALTGIYDVLFNEGLINIKYVMFTRHINNIKNEKDNEKEKTTTSSLR